MTDERWAPIPDWPQYSASTEGRIRSEARIVERTGRGTMRVKEKILKTPRDPGGYNRFNLADRGRTHPWGVHQAVMAAFVGPCPEGLEVRHLDGDPANNRLDNLAYGTRKQNVDDAKGHGTIPQGEDRHNAKLKKEDVLDIVTSNESAVVLAARYDVHRMTINQIRRGERWGKFTEELRKASYAKRGEAQHSARLTEENVLFILDNPDLSTPNLARRFGVGFRSVWQIRAGETWKHIPRP